MSTNRQQREPLSWARLAIAAVIGGLFAFVGGFAARAFFPYDVFYPMTLAWIAQAWLAGAVMCFVILLIARFAILSWLRPRTSLDFPLAAGGLVVVPFVILSIVEAATRAQSLQSATQYFAEAWSGLDSLGPKLIFGLAIAASAFVYDRLTAASGSGLRPSTPNS